MRKLGLSLLLCSMAAVPGAALSQEASTPDDYVCALTGECADDAQEATEPAQQSGDPRVSATRSFSLATPSNRPARTTSNRPRQAATRPAPARPRVATSQPGRVNLRISFGAGSAVLSSAAQAQVRAFAAALKRPQLSTMRFMIEGHTDSGGGRALNLGLSQRRAQAVADYMVGQGIDSARIEARGYGFDRPLSGRPASADANRRVEAVRISS